MTKGGSYALGTSTPLESSKSQDVMRSIELLGKEVIPALHAIKLQPYEEAGTHAVSHR